MAGKTAKQKAKKTEELAGATIIDLKVDEPITETASQKRIRLTKELSEAISEENVVKTELVEKFKAVGVLDILISEAEAVQANFTYQHGEMMVTVKPVGAVNIRTGSSGKGKVHTVKDLKTGETYEGTQKELCISIGKANGHENGYAWFKSVTTAKHENADRYEIGLKEVVTETPPKAEKE